MVSEPQIPHSSGFDPIASFRRWELQPHIRRHQQLFLLSTLIPVYAEINNHENETRTFRHQLIDCALVGITSGKFDKVLARAKRCQEYVVAYDWLADRADLTVRRQHALAMYLSAYAVSVGLFYPIVWFRQLLHLLFIDDGRKACNFLRNAPDWDAIPLADGYGLLEHGAPGRQGYRQRIIVANLLSELTDFLPEFPSLWGYEPQLKPVVTPMPYVAAQREGVAVTFKRQIEHLP
jgi:hypothetical protein